jgi:hypothetical protein
MKAVKWKMGRLREHANEGWTSPLVWWVRETEAKQKMRDLNQKIAALESVIKEAGIQKEVAK